MPPDPNPQNGFCKGHTGLIEAVDHIKRTQRARDDTVTRLWEAIECRVSMKAFLAIITVAVAIFSIIMGAVFFNQHQLLASLIRSQEILATKMGNIQENISEKMGNMKIDIEIIKQQVRQEGIDRRKYQRQDCDPRTSK
jgi:hypothetical protein